MKPGLAIALAVVLAVPAAAHAELDFGSIIEKGPPPLDSVEGAEFCAAVSLYLEFNTSDKDAGHRYDVDAHRWAGIASGLKGDALEDYMDETVMEDAAGVNGLIQGDPGSQGYYVDYCDKAAAQKP